MAKIAIATIGTTTPMATVAPVSRPPLLPPLEESLSGNPVDCVLVDVVESEGGSLVDVTMTTSVLLASEGRIVTTLEDGSEDCGAELGSGAEEASDGLADVCVERVVGSDEVGC